MELEADRHEELPQKAPCEESVLLQRLRPSGAVSGAGRKVLGGVRRVPLIRGGRQLGSPVALRRIEDDESQTKNFPLQCVEGAIGISQVSLGKREKGGH